MNSMEMRKKLRAFLPKKKDLVLKPVLSESPASRYFSFSLLYFAQGVPEGLTFFAIPAFLAMNGVSPLIIGSYLAMITLPWSLKLILAPLMDRYTIKSMGRKRPWVLFGQIGLVISFMTLSTLQDPVGNIGILMAMGLMVSFFGCFQDVATDGMAVDIIPIKEQARANGLMWGSKLIGISISLAVGTYTINRFGFSIGVLAPAVFTSILILVPLIFLERKGERRLPWTRGQASVESLQLQPENMIQIIRDTYRVASRNSSMVLIVVMALTGFVTAYMEAIIPIFTIQELGWTNAEYSNLYSSANLTGGLLGMFVGGGLVDLFGKKRMFIIYAVLWLLTLGGFLFYQAAWFSSAVVSFLVFAAASFYIFTTIASFTVCMSHCWKRVSATQFTLYMTISNLGRSGGSASAGYAKESFDWYSTFSIVLIVLIVVILLIGLIRISKQLKTIDRLEENTLDKAKPVLPMFDI